MKQTFNKSGQTLLTTIIGVIILCFTGLSVLYLYTTGNNINANFQKDKEIINIENNINNKIRNTPYKNIISSNNIYNDNYKYLLTVTNNTKDDYKTINCQIINMSTNEIVDNFSLNKLKFSPTQTITINATVDDDAFWYLSKSSNNSDGVFFGGEHIYNFGLKYVITDLTQDKYYLNLHINNWQGSCRSRYGFAGYITISDGPYYFSATGTHYINTNYPIKVNGTHFGDFMSPGYGNMDLDDGSYTDLWTPFCSADAYFQIDIKKSTQDSFSTLYEY